MKTINVLAGLRRPLLVGVGAAILIAAAPGAFAKTPDGMPPSQETVCSGLTGAAFGLCNAYCEAQDCDVHPRPSCPVLRRNFEKTTGSAVFPCDRRCGNGTIEGDEECDPPRSGCPDGRICNADCTCPLPFCGDQMIDPGEECDPPGSPCTTGLPCLGDCTCEAHLVCCECAGTSPSCLNPVPSSVCETRPGCSVGPAGSTCDSTSTRCLVPQPSCCFCPQGCLTVPSPGFCPTGCSAGPAGICAANGECQPLPEP
jgi:hypothetical protein